MARTISDEQREKLWTVADSMELVISQIEGHSIILNRIAECAEGHADGTAVFAVSNALSENVRQLSEAQEKLFHGLHVRDGLASKTEVVEKAGAS